MSPRNEASQSFTENTPLVSYQDSIRVDNINDANLSYSGDEGGGSTFSYCSIDGPYDQHLDSKATNISKILISLLGLSLVTLLSNHIHVLIRTPENGGSNSTNVRDHSSSSMVPIGPYKLVEKQEGMEFFNYYTFYTGNDSLGSAGYNTYISKEEAEMLKLVGVVNDTEMSEEFIFMKSSPTTKGPRSSIRLEGKRRFDRGLFILDLRHMPNGPGVWPAFWLTDEANWPDNGEIDIVEGINNQTVAKTALHTSKDCDMFAHVSDYAKTGTWEWSTGLPDTFTGIADYKTVKEADNCWNWAPHQWFNQGCVEVSTEDGTLGKPLNDKGGGVYALEWDPENHYIRSWVFTPLATTPQNIIDAINTSGNAEKDRVEPDTKLWGLPYAYFAIGDNTGCSADHFKNMRVVWNLAFCGTVAGNRFFRDCPMEGKLFNVSNDPVASCDAYIKSDPDALLEAYWKIKGLYIYERQMTVSKRTNITRLL